MRRVTIDLPDNYDGALSITAIGGFGGSNIQITTYVADSQQGTYLVNDGKKWFQKKEKEEFEI